MRVPSCGTSTESDLRRYRAPCQEGRLNHLVWENIDAVLTAYFATEGPLYVLCPFISTQTATRTLEERRGKTTTIVTSWCFEDLLRGVSSLDLYTLCKKNGWTLYTNEVLHAKVYSSCLRSAWVGSANLTDRGVGATHPHNLEVLALTDPLNAGFRRWIMWIVARSRLVTDELHGWYAGRLMDLRSGRVPLGSEGEEPEVPGNVRDPFLVSQLPASESPERMWQVLMDEPSIWEELMAAEHDLALYQVNPSGGYDEFSTKLTKSFFDHPFIQTLAATIDAEGMRFGAVKEWVQKTCTDVPVPYRKELTSNIQALYAWFVSLAPHEYEIFQPNVSEILRRVSR